MNKLDVFIKELCGVFSKNGNITFGFIDPIIYEKIN